MTIFGQCYDLLNNNMEYLYSFCMLLVFQKKIISVSLSGVDKKLLVIIFYNFSPSFIFFQD